MGWANGQSMIKLGLTNRDSEDLGSLSSPRKYLVRKAYCTSLQCNGKGSAHRRQEKRVSANAWKCPDCGYALFWESE